MNKTSIILGALVALAFAHTAVGFGAQDCTPEANHAWVFGSSVTLTDGTGTFYTATGALNSADPTDFGPASNSVGVGATLVTDSNVLGDCNGDGQPGDFDGDLDVGLGGFFYGSGLTWESLCHYGWNVHGIVGTTSDVAGLPYVVNIGIDDPNGPTPPVVDPTTGQTLQGCQTDGVIATDDTNGTPAADGDCQVAYAGNGGYGPVCGGGVGGDDGYWGFVDPDCGWPPVHCEGSVAGNSVSSP